MLRLPLSGAALQSCGSSALAAEGGHRLRADCAGESGGTNLRFGSGHDFSRAEKEPFLTSGFSR
jgi:hypothetical protein